MSPLSLVIIAAVCNVIDVYCLKASAGLTRPWPTLGVIISILVTQWCTGIALSRGAQLGFAVTAVVVLVVVFAGVAGPFLGDPAPSALKIVRYTVALIGIIIVNVAK